MSGSSTINKGIDVDFHLLTFLGTIFSRARGTAQRRQRCRSVCLSLGPTLWSKLKYINNSRSDGNEILHSLSLSLRMQLIEFL